MNLSQETYPRNNKVVLILLIYPTEQRHVLRGGLPGHLEGYGRRARPRPRQVHRRLQLQPDADEAAPRHESRQACCYTSRGNCGLFYPYPQLFRVIYVERLSMLLPSGIR